MERNVPIVFAAGYDENALPARYAAIPCCEKPLEAAGLAAALSL